MGSVSFNLKISLSGYTENTYIKIIVRRRVVYMPGFKTREITNYWKGTFNLHILTSTQIFAIVRHSNPIDITYEFSIYTEWDNIR